MLKNMPQVVKNILIINILLYIASMSSPWIYEHFALHNIGSYKFEPWQLVTHIFMHSQGSFMHIGFNMFALVMFGSPLEKMWGSKRFLIFYFVSALGALMLQLGINYYDYYSFFEQFSAAEMTDIKVNALNLFEGESYPKSWVEYYEYSNAAMVGASGAIMGLLAAFAYLFPNTEMMLIFLPVPIKAKYFMPIYMTSKPPPSTACKLWLITKAFLVTIFNYPFSKNSRVFLFLGK